MDDDSGFLVIAFKPTNLVEDKVCATLLGTEVIGPRASSRLDGVNPGSNSRMRLPTLATVAEQFELHLLLL